jgi:hypothetical protein
MDEPKTRTEKKGRDKQNPCSVYSSRHVRELERLMEKKAVTATTTTTTTTDKKKPLEKK